MKRSTLVLDFDKTLTFHHAYDAVYYNGIHLTPKNIIFLMGGETRIETLRDFLKKCLAKGIPIHLSTYNYLDDVIKILKYLNFLSFFTSINATNKNTSSRIVLYKGMLYNISNGKLVFLKTLQKPLLVDDTLVDNVELQYHNKTPLDKKDFEKILSFF